MWARDTWLCCSAHTGIEVASRDPLWDYIDVFFLWDFPWLPLHILSKDPLIGPDVVGLPSEVAKRITFEE
jgi:hypothetical protein